MRPEAIGGLLCGMVFSASIGSLIGSIILRAAAKWAENLDFPFGEAYATVLFTFLINIAIGVPIGFIVGASGGGRSAELAMQAFLLPVGFLVQSGMISSRHNLPFAKGLKIAGFMYLISLLICVVLGGVAFALLYAGR